MAYDLSFDRVIKVSTEAALALNKAVAAKLIQKYPEVYDSNSVSSGGHFLEREIECLDKEFPEKHFRLHADSENVWFSFEFWKDTVWLELGGNRDTSSKLAQIRNYADFFEQQGCIVYVPPAGSATTFDARIAWHMKGYKEWIGCVEQVKNTLANKP
ncbi:hypothetical protein [Hymenobacter metallilatus]|uniref:Uncharacterized protein n=1 Tax=Hymenobacter metallilatus TaxID=2493666 RepID=A0A3R9M9B2_9BACT|nr:hypothetical protein [Hymenobacter metallilatus]RSK36003.1 hypothetical protein EI290_03675 [Hymenobacter metallilatus]